MPLSQPILGSVQALWRYPVKSMRGEPLGEALVAERGLLGDRAYAIQERATGHIASAKHPRKWGALLACRAAFEAPPQPGAPPPPVRITFPGGEAVSSADPAVDQRLSAYLGRAVALISEPPARATREANRAPLDAAGPAELIREELIAAAAPPGALFDYAVLHLLTTATLAALGAAYPAGRFAVERLRPNIVVATAEGEGFVENGWLGQALLLGATARLALIDPCPRCVVTTLPQGDLPHDPEILRTIGRQNAAPSRTAAPGRLMQAVAGVYASVLAGGALRLGERVALGAA